MKFTLALLVLAFVSASYADEGIPYSIGASTATEVVPHMVAISIYASHGARGFCGGAIIGKRHILTAAHCFPKQYRLSGVRIFYGATYLNDRKGVPVEVQKIIRHEKYIGGSEHNNDIAILKLKKDIIFGEKAQPVELPKCKGCNKATSGFFAGWGRTAKSNITPNLQIITLNIISKEKCRRQMRGVNSKHLCTLNGKGQGICHGDSGGPLVANGEVVGIASFIKSNYKKDCALGFPDVFTRVDEYLDWIKQHTK